MYPYQQPQYTPPPVQPPAPKKRWGKGKRIIIGLVAVFVLSAVIAGVIEGLSGGNSTQSTIQPTAAPTQAAQQATQAPTLEPTQAPTISPAVLEATYKASTTDTTVSDLDKNGNTWNGKDVHFTATIFGFVKDNSGNTAGANVDDPTSSGVIQIAFPPNTDLGRLNQSDTIEVWGLDGGTASGQNAFGATVQEVVISALYLTDTTTGYQTQ